VKLGSSNDDTIIATTMGDVEAMMDPEEKSTIIQIFKRHNNQHVWLWVLIYKEIKMESSSMILRVWLVLFNGLVKRTTTLLISDLSYAGIEDYQRQLLLNSYCK
jgi:hypothetical protein